MKKFFAGLMLAAAMFLTACDSGISAGEIYEKDYRPSWTETKTDPVKNSEGKITSYKTRQVHHNAEYYFLLRDCENRNDKGDCRTGKVRVNEGTFATKNEGEWFVK